MQKARLVRFYGLSLEDVDDLTNEEFVNLWEAITPIEATEVFLSVHANSINKMKSSDRQRAIQELQDKMRLKETEVLKVESFADLAAYL